MVFSGKRSSPLVAIRPVVERAYFWKRAPCATTARRVARVFSKAPFNCSRLKIDWRSLVDSTATRPRSRTMRFVPTRTTTTTTTYLAGRAWTKRESCRARGRADASHERDTSGLLVLLRRLSGPVGASRLAWSSARADAADHKSGRCTYGESWVVSRAWHARCSIPVRRFYFTLATERWRKKK